MKKPSIVVRRRQRKNILIALQPILSSERMNAALQRFIARQPIDGEPDHRAETCWQPAPPISIVNTQVPLVTAE